MLLRRPVDGPTGPVTEIAILRVPTLADVLGLGIDTQPGDLDGEALAPIIAACSGQPLSVVLALGMPDALGLAGELLGLARTDTPPGSSMGARYTESRRGHATTQIGLTAPIGVLAQPCHALAYAEPTLQGLRKIKLSQVTAASPLAGVTYRDLVPLYVQALGISEAEALTLSWQDADRIAGVLLPLGFGAAPPTGE